MPPCSYEQLGCAPGVLTALVGQGMWSALFPDTAPTAKDITPHQLRWVCQDLLGKMVSSGDLVVQEDSEQSAAASEALKAMQAAWGETAKRTNRSYTAPY